ncbi:MAG: TatD family hydrolase [Bacteriovoracaceae bacterium]|jgi:TatD DNase family protein|nr:TatD family hydrolase [Bacteriovoracaceae bacterium]
MIIETHCHLDYLKAKPLDEILLEAKENGIEKIITIAVDPDNLDSVLELSQKYEEVYFTQGIHPHDAKDATDETYKIIESRVHEKKLVAIGEIGLDYHYDNSPRNIQREVFKKHLEIAIKYDLPVVIHSRDADEDMIEILNEYAPNLKRKGVIHSFTSGVELANMALKLGFYLGFNGIITFKKAENVRQIVELCPINRILVETDAPFLSPVPFRGKENSPKNLPYIIEQISRIKNIEIKQVQGITCENAKKLFKL